MSRYYPLAVEMKCYLCAQHPANPQPSSFLSHSFSSWILLFLSSIESLGSPGNQDCQVPESRGLPASSPSLRLAGIETPASGAPPYPHLTLDCCIFA